MTQDDSVFTLLISAFFNYISGGAIAPPGKEFAPPPSEAISAPEVRSRIAHDCCQNCS